MIAQTRRAFTLVELMVSVMVLAMLAAFTVPTYQLLLSQQQLSSATADVADFIRLTSQKTVTEQVVYGFTVTANAKTITMFSVNGATQTVVQTLTLPSSIQVGTVNFSGNSDVRFSTNGAPSVSGNFTLLDTNRARSRLIEVRPSGNIRTNAPES